METVKENLKELEKLECPKCKSKLVEFGCLTIKKQTGELRFCSKCYGDWLEANIPQYAMPQMPEGKE